jgi:hypothetical protein
MSVKYNNIKKWLEQHDYTILSNLDEMIETNKIRYQCRLSHETELTTTSFGNKKNKCKNSPELLCTGCTKGTKSQDRFETLKDELLDKTGHILLTLSTGRKITYQCGNCNAQNESYVSNLLKKGRTKFCPKCQNDGNKNTIEDVEEKLRELDINYTVESYVNNKEIEMRCDQGHLFKGVLHDLHRNRRCPHCAPERRAKTNIDKYGCENPFQNNGVKQKIKNTCREKYGVDHHLQLDIIKENVKKTCEEKYGVKYAFHMDKSFEKSRKTCEERYGHKFPLQSRAIQAKIKMMMEKYGSEYFINSDACKEMMMEKYGSEYFVNSDACKEMMMEKYGSEYFINSDACKEMMKEKYGSEYPMQCPDLYYKALVSRFTRKQYVFNSGRKEMLLGYEPHCVDDLLKEYDEEDIILDPRIIPTFDYKKIREDGSIYDAKYFPDILVVNDNRKFFIEVKSNWTWNIDIENNKKKIQAVKAEGEDIEVWIYDNKICIDKIC